MITAGADVGSKTVKVVILKDGEIAGKGIATAGLEAEGAWNKAWDAALKEAEEAASRVREDQQPIELSPQSAYIRRLQHLIAERNNLLSKSSGKEPSRRVRIYRE